MDKLKSALLAARLKADEHHQAVREAIDRYYQEAAAIIDVWNQTGICGVSETHEEVMKGWLPELGAISSTLREQAKAADRPFLLLRSGFRYATGNKSVSYSHLTVPNSKRLDQVVAPLLILTREVFPAGNGNFDTHTNVRVIGALLADNAAVRVNTPRQWHFCFNENAATRGPEIFANFTHLCRTDPVFRVALRLP